ncbi:SDR family oxidoreductase [Paenarthrobacter sp. PH39-S1]|uniref:SDR family oxidoreductase n=1 Tax=Paenarthrobacter sp. PH39-S1 TaxID=3046204 RepID=UPI0024B91F71|nr:SDR family oxidoreductase [Paenarthrobacter sp. PH39-S1]MDJ0356599.1 SDR family oxidoreductase [Paenarthrobacter sp. PH39-S1]
MRIAIAGGTGTVGRHVVTATREAGHEPIVLSRSNGVDLMSTDGLAGALSDIDAVIDVSSTNSLSAKQAVRFFGTVTENLLNAERAAGVTHHVTLSIIGAAHANSGYYAGKAIQEERVMRSGGAWSMLRTTQFHEFAAQTAHRRSIAGIQIVPAMRSQPIAAAEVATTLVNIATGVPRGLEPDLAGPRQENMPDMVRRYLKAAHIRRIVLRVPLPGAMGKSMRDGGLLPSPSTRIGTQTFDQWLASNDWTRGGTDGHISSRGS